MQNDAHFDLGDRKKHEDREVKVIHYNVKIVLSEYYD